MPDALCILQNVGKKTSSMYDYNTRRCNIPFYQRVLNTTLRLADVVVNAPVTVTTAVAAGAIQHMD